MNRQPPSSLRQLQRRRDCNRRGVDRHRFAPASAARLFCLRRLRPARVPDPGSGSSHNGNLASVLDCRASFTARDRYRAGTAILCRIVYPRPRRLLAAGGNQQPARLCPGPELLSQARVCGACSNCGLLQAFGRHDHLWKAPSVRLKSRAALPSIRRHYENWREIRVTASQDHPHRERNEYPEDTRLAPSVRRSSA